MLTYRFFIIMFVCIAFALASAIWIPLYILSIVIVAIAAVVTLTDIGVCVYLSRQVSVRRDAAEYLSLDQPNIVKVKVSLKVPAWLSRLASIETFPTLPKGFSAVSEKKLVGTGDFTYTITPSSRGRHKLGTMRCFVSTRFPGLFILPRFFYPDTMVKVYPTFMHLDKLETMALNSDLHNGAKRLRRAGNSTEFDRIRPYVPGDDVRTVNWKATARAANLMVNTYTDERSRPIIPVLCAGPSMLTDSGNISLLDRAASAAVALASSAIRHYDQAGLITLTHAGVETYLKPERSNGAVSRILEAIYSFGLPPTETEMQYIDDPDVPPEDITTEEYEVLKERLKSTKADPDFEALANYVLNRVKRRSMLLVLANFENFEIAQLALDSLRRISKRHTLVLILLQNEQVEQVAMAPYRKDREGAETASGRLSELRFRALCADYIEQQQYLAENLAANGIYVISTTPSRISVAVLQKYLELKNRNIL